MATKAQPQGLNIEIKKEFICLWFNFYFVCFSKIVGIVF